jgi:putative transposase
MPRPKNPTNPFRYFNSSPEIIRLVVMMALSEQTHQLP